MDTKNYIQDKNKKLNSLEKLVCFTMLINMLSASILVYLAIKFKTVEVYNSNDNYSPTLLLFTSFLLMYFILFKKYFTFEQINSYNQEFKKNKRTRMSFTMSLYLILKSFLFLIFSIIFSSDVFLSIFIKPETKEVFVKKYITEYYDKSSKRTRYFIKISDFNRNNNSFNNFELILGKDEWNKINNNSFYNLTLKNGIYSYIFVDMKPISLDSISLESKKLYSNFIQNNSIKEYSCDKEKELKSMFGNLKEININFTNNTGNTIKLYWLDYDGNRVIYKNDLFDYQIYNQGTVVNQFWLISDINDNCLKIFSFVDNSANNKEIIIK